MNSSNMNKNKIKENNFNKNTSPCVDLIGEFS